MATLDSSDARRRDAVDRIGERLEADIAADSRDRADYLASVARDTGCGPECKILSSWAIRELADIVWHGTPRMRAELHIHDGKLYQDRARIVAWIKALHDAEKAVFGHE